MGGAGSSRLVAAHPEKFDAAGFLGGPIDALLMMETLMQSSLGGFCAPELLEAAAALDKADGDNRLDRPDGIPGCTQTNPPPVTQYSRSQRFNHWAYTTNGGNFDRGMHLDIFHDLTLAVGNPLAWPYPPEKTFSGCVQQVAISHVWDSPWSLYGQHSAITFCDGDAPIMLCADGTLVDWCAAAKLAGRHLAQTSDATAFCASHGGGAHGADRNNPAEADVWFAHTGEVPGCFPGTQTVPFALAIDINGNGRRDYHEPLLLQAMSAPVQAWFDGDLKQHLPPNVDLYLEGGIRDVFDLGAMAEGVAEAAPNLSRFDDFKSIPPARGGAWGSTFDPLAIDTSVLGPNVLLTYGKRNATAAEIRAGDGDHVGTADQLFDRFVVFFRWLSKRWDPMLPAPRRGEGKVTVSSFYSTALGAMQDYAVSVPAHYDENPDARFPVLFLLHGYGQNAEDMAGTDLAIQALADLGLVHDMIVVYPSGRCCLKGPHGEKTCDESNGTPAGYVRECARGSFYLDRPGSLYGSALFELMDEVDKNYRTLSPADGPAF